MKPRLPAFGASAIVDHCMFSPPRPHGSLQMSPPCPGSIRSSALARLLVLAPLLLFGTLCVATDEDSRWAGGIWKSTPVPAGAKGEFGNQDPYGLSIGVRIHTDCSIYWISPDTRKLYCFNSLTSKSFFIDNPAHYIRGAEALLAQ